MHQELNHTSLHIFAKEDQNRCLVYLHGMSRMQLVFLYEKLLRVVLVDSVDT